MYIILLRNILNVHEAKFLSAIFIAVYHVLYYVFSDLTQCCNEIVFDVCTDVLHEAEFTRGTRDIDFTVRLGFEFETTMLW